MNQVKKDYMLAPAASAPDQADSGLIERFKILAPLAFFGHGGVEKAKRWMRQVEKIFEILHCSDEKKVILDTFMMVGDVEHWWSSVKQSWMETEIAATWENFLVTLMRKAHKASKFERGLKPDIRGGVMSANLKTFSPLMDLATKIEKDFEEFQLRKEGRVRPPPSDNFGTKRNFRGRINQGNMKAQKTFSSDVRENQCPACLYYGRSNHSTTECQKKMRTCYECGKPGHLIKDCPVTKPENRPKTQVFTLMGDSMETDMVYKQCGFFLERCVLPIDFILLDIQDFDVILGRDWLCTHIATVDCYDKNVTFRPLTEPELHFVGIKDASPLHFVSALRAQRLLARKCVRYLVYVVENWGVQSKLKEVPMVREYPEFFLKEFTSLSAVRKIEFETDLTPDTAPISKAHIRWHHQN
ncbi:uncharacterized protein LOC110007554 [Amborella trichopoda]|uniref:uncharacterized protein LOC110007554 n=1 Tax=Amborella trichopoda TaxID=13333 RepID=UPI0009BFA7D1|nr:uncharacterized protein LOC110007554 [Amborella trichopoda]|eukprot:XP_020524746.1 uncharacterized protein LOC110007554 [Amborella trichopoda]